MFLSDDYGKVFFPDVSFAKGKYIETIRESLLAYKPNIILPNTGESVFLQLLENDPYQIALSGYQFVSSPAILSVQPIYVYSKYEGNAILHECLVQRNIIVRHIGVQEDEYSMVKKVHDILSRNIEYVKGESAELHSIVGPLTKKRGVCDGFAKSFKFLLDELSIPSIVIKGLGYNQITKSEEPHAWNLVCINGEWTHIDLTFDTTIRECGVLRYDYFGLSDEEILKDHNFERSAYPEAMASHFSYYKKTGMLFESKSNLLSHLCNSLQRGDKDLVFKLPSRTNESTMEAQVISEIGRFLFNHHTNVGYTLYFNVKQKVFQIHFDY